MAKEYLDLPLEKKHKLSIDYDVFGEIKEELEEFIASEEHVNNRSFAKKVMIAGEVKSNNTIEGINDNILLIEEVIKDALEIKDEKIRKRIINLYKGYKYILTHKTIDQEHLHTLYGILSSDLLEQSDKSRMGILYRTAPVYILKNGRLDTELDEGLPASLIEKYMDYYFAFAKEKLSDSSTLTDHFIKSQIMHFYFVYIHPYFDVNGRTSRTLSMWYLLNNSAYPYIIFNRAITFDSSHYDKAIIDTKNFADISFFIKYMMVNVKKELEKEHIMHQIAEYSPTKLDSIDYQTLIYFLSMNGEINVLNFVSMYHRFNDHNSVKDIYAQMIDPLIQKGIIEVYRTTSKQMFDGFPNEVLRLNPRSYDQSSPKIKRLNLTNK